MEDENDKNTKQTSCAGLGSLGREIHFLDRRDFRGTIQRPQATLRRARTHSCWIRTEVQEQRRGAGRKWRRISHAVRHGRESAAVEASIDVIRVGLWPKSELARIARVKVLLASVSHEFVVQVYAVLRGLAIFPCGANLHVRTHCMLYLTYAAIQS